MRYYLLGCLESVGSEAKLDGAEIALGGYYY
jgi:hypothetical protein